MMKCTKKNIKGLFGKRGLALLVCLMLIGLLAGCGGQSTSDEPAGSTPNEATTLTITDMAGRTHEIPSQIEKIYGTDPIASILSYTFDPELLAGWNYKFNDLEKAYILPEYHDLTAFGMGDGVNLEAIIQAGPQICIQAGALKDAEKASADKLQEQLGIPVIMVDGSLENSPATYKFLGEILNMKDRATELADYAAKLIDRANGAVIPGGGSVTAYFGNGADSLETAPPGSPAAAILDLVKADNVAKVDKIDGARMQISLEQLLAWDPAVIFVSGEPKQGLSGPQAAQAMLENPDLATLQAVKNGKIYGIPKSPFTWMGRPMGVNQLIGLAWAGHLLYPEQYDYDMNTEVARFYSMFYHIDLSEAQVASLFND